MLINQKAVRDHILTLAKQIRPHHPFERVGASFLARVEGAVRSAITREIQQHPSKGKTLL
jgi:hypothetical protein